MSTGAIAGQENGQQDPEDGTRGIDPEVANSGRLLARDAADKGHGNGDADGRAEEIVIGQARHLREMTHGDRAG